MENRTFGKTEIFKQKFCILKYINIRRNIARQDDERILLLRCQDDETLSNGSSCIH